MLAVTSGGHDWLKLISSRAFLTYASGMSADHGIPVWKAVWRDP
jgi:hypothetical protein